MKELPSKLEALSDKGFSYAVLDTPSVIAKDIQAIIKQADFVLIPTYPKPYDLRAVVSTLELVTDASLPFAFVITRAEMKSRLTVQADCSFTIRRCLSRCCAQSGCFFLFND